MAMNLDETFCFLPANHDLGGSDRRTWERGKAKALSHAARVAHRSKDSKKKRKEQDHQSASPAAQSSPIINTGLCDLFVGFPIDLPFEDRELLHGYLANVPGDFYGTSATSSFCPVRDVTLGVLSNNRILLSWATLFMQHRRALLRDTDPYQDTRVLHRRRRTYKTMSIHIHDQQSAISEEAMYGLAFSALLEDRLGDQLTAQKHLQACLITRRLRVQKGLTVLSYPMGTLCIPVCIQVGVPEYFRTLEEVRNAGFNLKKLLWSLQEWRYGTTNTTGGRDITGTPQSVWAGLMHVSPESVREQKSTLRYHLMRSVQETSSAGIRLCLALLTTIGVILQTLYQNGNGAAEFLHLIIHCFSEDSSSVRAEKIDKTTLGMLYTTFMCINQVQSSTSGPYCVIDLWQTVDVVELLTFATPSSRARVKQTIISWILDELQDHTAPRPCDDIFQDYLIEDVETAWLSRRVHETGISQDSSSHRHLPAPAPAPSKLRYASSCTELARTSCKQSPTASPENSG